MQDVISLILGSAIGTWVLLLILALVLKSMVSTTKEEIGVEIDNRLQMAFDQLGDTLNDVFTSPLAKRAMSIIGNKGGASKAQTAVMNKMATDVLDGPQLAGMKMMANQLLGIDIDKYIDQHGPVNTLQAIQQFAPIMGIDLSKISVEGLMGNSPGESTKNPYL